MSAIGRLANYAFRNAVALDQMANTLFGGNPDETLSSRGHKARERWRLQRRPRYLWGCILCGVLDFLFTDHCQRSCERDEGK